MASIRKRGKSYQITVSRGYTPQGDKITQTTTYTPDYYTATGRAKAPSVIERDVAAFAADFEGQVKSGAVIANRTMTFAQLAQDYLDNYAATELQITTADGYREVLDNYLLPAWGHFKIKDLCQDVIGLQRYFNDMTREPGRRGKIVSIATIRRRIAVMSSVMSWAVDMRLIPHNPLSNVHPPQDTRCV